jgi:hypothetical protein
MCSTRSALSFGCGLQLCMGRDLCWTVDGVARMKDTLGHDTHMTQMTQMTHT